MVDICKRNVQTIFATKLSNASVYFSMLKVDVLLVVDDYLFVLFRLLLTYTYDAYTVNVNLFILLSPSYTTLIPSWDAV